MATNSSILAWRIPMDGGAWRATVHVVPKSQTQLSNLTQEIIKSFLISEDLAMPENHSEHQCRMLRCGLCKGDCVPTPRHTLQAACGVILVITVFC